MSRRWLAPAALLVPVALSLLAIGEPVPIAVLATPIGVAVFRRGRFDFGVPAQVLLLLGCGFAAFILEVIWPAGRGIAEQALRPAWVQLAYASIALGGVRLHLRAPALGTGGTLATGLLVFLACGTVAVGRLHPVLMFAFAVLAFAALRSDDVALGGRPPGIAQNVRVWLASGLVVLVSVSLTGALAGAIPRLHALAYDWALGMVGERHRAGFHDGPMALGALGDLLESDEIVMRVEGDPGDRLRGHVYTHYGRGRWLPPPEREERSVDIVRAGEDEVVGGPVRAIVRYATTEVDRFFLPTVAGGFRLEPDTIRVDDFGVVRTLGKRPATRIVLLDDPERPFASRGPEVGDRLVPDSVRDVVDEFVARWTDPEDLPAARVAALRVALESGYRYSLDGPSGEHVDAVDPLVAFLTDHREGHCEYFASAMTLLARGAGVPARLVTGYRIAEHNRFGDYAIVRERHAHAWTEVFLDGLGWVDVDPSPLQGAMPGEPAWTPWWPALVDRGVVAWQRRGPEWLLAALVVVLAGVQIGRIRRDRASTGVAAEAVVEPPPEWLIALLDRLRARGVARADSEPLESLARRLRAGSRRRERDAEALGEAALLLRRYTALRYGGEGSPERLREDFVRWTGQFAAGSGEGGGPTTASP